MEAILKKDKLGQWVTTLQDRAEVYAPDFVEDAWAFTKVEPGATAELDHSNTVRPAKGFVFPQREVLYRFRLENGKEPQITDSEPKVEPTPEPKTPAIGPKERPKFDHVVVNDDVERATREVAAILNTRRTLEGA